MSDINLRQGIQGFFTLITILCGLFLFSMLNVRDMGGTLLMVVG